MSLFRWIKGTFRSLYRKTQLDGELDRELDSILDLLVREKIQAGIPPEQARREARLELGGTDQVKEQVREERMGASLDTLTQDIRYSFRALRKDATLTSIAVLILAIGIGANTALFGTVNSVLLRNLPYPEAQQLVAGGTMWEGGYLGSVSRVDYFDYREMGSSFQELAILANFTTQHTVTGGGDPELVQAAYGTWNLFSALGVFPVVGRPFLPAEEAQGGASTILISHGYWQRRFGGAADAVGSTLTLDGQPQTIVGVMPPGFHFIHDADLWSLIHVDGPFDLRRDSHSHTLVGRMAEGVSLEQAQAEMDGISSALANSYPESNTGKGLRLSGLHEYMARDARTSLLLLLGTTLFVILIACGNVAGLLLTRGERRQTEMAMRTALGASRGRLLRQLLTESVILTLSAGVLGVVVARLLQDLLLRLLPMGDMSIQPQGINLPVLGFTFLLSVGTGILVGIVPAIRNSSLDPATQLKSESRSSPSARSTRLRSGLVVLQVSLSVVLLIGSGLLIRSLARLSSVELGFDQENLLTGQLQIQGPDYPTPAERNLFFSSLLAEVEALPSVEGATLINKLPILSRWQDWSIWPVGDPPDSPPEGVSAMARWVTPGYFPTMGVPMLSGRDISDRDTPESPFVVVISRSVAETFFPNADPLGQQVRIGDWRDCQVVGVVEDARVNTLRGDPDRAIYMAAAQISPLQLQIAVRTAGNPELLIRPIEELLHRKDPNVLFAQARSMASVVEENLTGFRTIILSLVLFAGMAVLLAAIGLYGLLAYQVTQRKAELGLRLAIGASEDQLVGVILRRGLGLAVAGLAVGLSVAYPATLVLKTLLYRIQLLDLQTYTIAGLALLLIAALASYIPARRVRGGDIVNVLRME